MYEKVLHMRKELIEVWNYKLQELLPILIESIFAPLDLSFVFMFNDSPEKLLPFYFYISFTLVWFLNDSF